MKVRGRLPRTPLVMEYLVGSDGSSGLGLMAKYLADHASSGMAG